MEKPALERLKKQIEFIVEADKIKNIVRMNYNAGGARRENDAEHSWHLALIALTLHEYANSKIDPMKVVKMVLIHDIVEIDAGDAYVYDEEARAAQREKELKAAERIFNILPSDQAVEFRKLWDEFEEKSSPEARFANAIDRMHPMLMNYSSDGRSWKENNISGEMVEKKNRHMAEGSKDLWDYCMENILKPAKEKGFFKAD